MLRQLCKNDAYLYEQIMALWDETDPQSRKRFYPPYYMDASVSFGVENYSFEGYYDTEFFKYCQSVYRFNTLTEYRFKIDFNGKNESMANVVDSMDATKHYTSINADNYLDLENNNNELMLEIIREDSSGNSGGGATLRPPVTTSTYREAFQYDAVYKNVPNNKKKYVKSVKEKLGKSKKDAYFYGAFKNWHCNNHWHNGFDRSKNYNIKAKWEKNPDTYDIPSVCHAQTFKALSTGRLNKVNLNITGDKNAKSPCIVEIRTTKGGKPTTKVLARTEKKFSANGQKVTAFEFKSGMAKIEKGKTYAIVVRSPLSTFAKSYKLGGWTTGCFSSEKKYYSGGSAFTSTDNGKTWVKNGKTKDTKSYGAHYYDWGINQKPIDFAFEVHVQPILSTGVKKTTKKQQGNKTKKTLVSSAYTEYFDYEFTYYKAGRYYLHLKPIQTNPIDFANIYSTFNDGETSCEYWGWEYFDYETRKWRTVNGRIDFDNNTIKPTVLMLRVWCDVSENTLGEILSTNVSYEGTPAVISNSTNNKVLTNLISKNKIKQFGLTFLSNVEIIVNCYENDKAYLRTQYYHPPKTDMLGASLWSEINLKAKTSGMAKLDIDVIHEKEVADHYKFIDLRVIEDVQHYDYNNTGGYDNKVVDTFETLSYYISMFERNTQTSYTSGAQVINYVLQSLNDGRGFLEYLKKQTTPIYIIQYTVEVDGTVEMYNFFDSLVLTHKPAYPLIGGDVGDDDIIIDTAQIKGFSEYGAYIWFPQPLTNFNGLNVTYNKYREDLETVTSQAYDLDNNDNLVELNGVYDTTYVDDDGFEVEPSSAEEQVVEKLTGIFLDCNSCIWSDNNNKTISGELFKKGNVIDTTIDYAITKDKKNIVFNGKSPIIQKIFPHCTIFNENNQGNAYDTTLFTSIGNETVLGAELKVDLMQKAYKEFVDFDVDYDEGELTFHDQSELVGGDFKITYNPLWVRGLSPADFPLALDLWVEKYEVMVDGIYKLKFNTDTGNWERGKFYTKTNMNPLTEQEDSRNFYRFNTTVPPLDSIRKLVVNEDNDLGGDSLVEDTQFFVNYLSNQITLSYAVNLNVGDILTIHYTPNLTDNGLALGFRMSRPRYRTNIVNDSNLISDGDSPSSILYEGDDGFMSGRVSDEDNVYIGMVSYTYRT